MSFESIPDLLGRVVAEQQETNRLLKALIPAPNVLDTAVEYLKQKAVVAEPDAPVAVIEAAPAPKKAKKAPKFDIQAARDKFVAFTSANGVESGKEILQRFNVGKVSDLAEMQIEQFIDALEGATV